MSEQLIVTDDTKLNFKGSIVLSPKRLSKISVAGTEEVTLTIVFLLEMIIVIQQLITAWKSIINTLRMPINKLWKCLQWLVVKRR